MNKLVRSKSLIVSIAIILSILLIVIISAISFMMYNSTQNEVFRKFTHVGEKLRDVAQADVSLIEKVATTMGAGAEPPQEDMAILTRVLDGTTDDYLVANAYYFSPDYEEDGENSYFTYLMTSESLKAMGMDSGTIYEDQGIFGEVFKQAVAGTSGLTKVFSDEHGYWITFLSPITDANGNIIAIYGVDFDYKSVKKRLDSLVLETISIGIISIIISTLIIIYILRRSLKPLQLLADRAKEAAAGDLTVNVPIKVDNEVGQAATAFNQMIMNLRELAIHINQTSNEVTSSSMQLKETASQTTYATNEITQSITQVAEGAEAQQVSSGECQIAMNEMAVGIQRIAESSSVVSELAAETAELATSGEGVMEQTEKQMSMIDGYVSEASGAMRELNASTEQIGAILAHIAEIANQTNLLALNASIEAARAGEHGQGFTVVAQEIRKLAESSKASSEEITAILYEIGNRSRVVANSLDVSTQEVREGTKLANESGRSFRSILQSVQQVSDQVQEVSAAAEQMSAGSEQIAASLDDLDRTAKTAASNVQNVAAASEEQLASVEDVSSASEQLNMLANELNQSVNRFKV